MRSRRLTLKQYLQFPTLCRTLAGQQTLVDRPLAQLGAKRTLWLVSFFGRRSLPSLNRLVLTLPRKLAKIAAGWLVCGSFDHSRNQGLPYFMAWHPRLTPEPAHAWFAKTAEVLGQFEQSCAR